MDLSREQLARVWLQCAPMGAWARLEGFKEKFGGALGVWENFTPQVYELLGTESFSYLADLRASRCASVLRELDSLNAYPVFFGEEGYPEPLLHIKSPPDVLFVRGALPKDFSRSIAMVGSRRATRYGLAQARRIAKGLAEKDVTVVSGLARGIDAASHQGALDGNGCTVAVLGSGIGRLYPRKTRSWPSVS
ncbi:MAG: DNA-processing protein DprA [Clostridia bacterium]|nr:DNA-processing protein DprA [Clostridia bacterium]